MLDRSHQLGAAYAHCARIAAQHYENFTVGSWLLPRRVRRHVAAIYAFARTADDFADEGDVPADERLRRLDAWERQLDQCSEGRTTDPIFVALAQTIRELDLPVEPFRRLLRAFRQDVRFTPFPTFPDLLAYCRNSANPVGELILNLFSYRDERLVRYSDDICTGLQLANFCQDVSVDVRRGRVYIPLDELHAVSCTVDDLHSTHVTPALRELMRLQVERARQKLLFGLPLCEAVNGRLKREVRLFASGGLSILDEIEARQLDVFSQRPTVPTWRKAGLVLRAALSASPASAP